MTRNDYFYESLFDPIDYPRFLKTSSLEMTSDYWRTLDCTCIFPIPKVDTIIETKKDLFSLKPIFSSPQLHGHTSKDEGDILIQGK